MLVTLFRGDAVDEARRPGLFHQAGDFARMSLCAGHRDVYEAALDLG
jgi:hypothetical protein